MYLFSEENDLNHSGIYLKPQEIKINMGEQTSDWEIRYCWNFGMFSINDWR